MKKFDLVIIGGGASGFAAATKADELKIKTAIINDGLPMGGTCVNVGCVPTKHMLGLGKKLYTPQFPQYKAVSSVKPDFDFAEAMREKNNLVTVLRQKNYHQVLDDFNYVTWFDGRGVFESDRIISIGNEKIEADKIIIATGCSAKILPIAGLKETGYLTNVDAFSLDKLPVSLTIIGGGPLGLEFAQIFNRMGTKVTIIEYSDRIIPMHEPEISRHLKKYLEEEGIKIVTNAKALNAAKTDKGKEVTFETGDDIKKIISAEILLAAGVSGNINGMGLEKIGIETENKCHIKTDEFLQTNIAHIYAAGDCTCHRCLETVAAKEGKIAVENAFEKADKKLILNEIPSAVFTEPEVASVGLTESDYMKMYNTCDCRTVYMEKVPKAVAVNETKGLIKMVAHHETGKIMGVHILSSVASEMIHEATLSVKFGLTVDKIIDTVHVFPTFSEAIKIAAQSFRRDITKMSCCVE